MDTTASRSTPRRDRMITNPAFDLSHEDARAEAHALAADPRPLKRPVVVLGGYRAPAFVSNRLAERLAALTSGRAEDFLPIAYPWLSSVPRCVDRTSDIISAHGPSRNTGEIDIVGISMGGLVARAFAARAARDSSLPRVRRVFTLATPHRGATLANFVRPDTAARQLHKDSAFLRELDERLEREPIDLTCYAILHDWWVGATNASPREPLPGCHPIWFDGATAMERAFAHFSICRAPRLLVDLARRLTGRTPLGGYSSPPPIN